MISYCNFIKIRIKPKRKFIINEKITILQYRDNYFNCNFQ